jgi:hypothetical protein
MKFTGWQRIGVVLSVIWLVGGSLMMWKASNDSAMDGYQAMLSICQSESIDASSENRTACIENAAATYMQARSFHPSDVVIVVILLACGGCSAWLACEHFGEFVPALLRSPYNLSDTGRSVPWLPSRYPRRATHRGLLRRPGRRSRAVRLWRQYPCRRCCRFSLRPVVARMSPPCPETETPAHGRGFVVALSY